MAFDYARSRATAESLIKRFGQTGTLHQVVNSGPEWAPVQTDIYTTITIVDLNERVRNADGTLTGQTQRTVYISTEAGVVPAKGNKIFVGLDKAAVEALTDEQRSEQSHEIGELRPLAPGGTAVMYEADLAT